MKREHQRLRRIALTRAQRHQRASNTPKNGARVPRFFPSPAAVIALLIVLVVAFSVALMRPHVASNTDAEVGLTTSPPRVSARSEESRGTPVPPGIPAPTTAHEGLGSEPHESVSELLIVQVSGAVNDPGVVEIPAGARGKDAIEVAGGLSDDADLSSVNLAAPVVDGQHIHVNTIGTMSGHGGTDTECIDIRVADETRLQDLTGIGPALAARIVEHRAAHPFTHANDLQNVSGIGIKTFERIKDQLCP